MKRKIFETVLSVLFSIIIGYCLVFYFTKVKAVPVFKNGKPHTITFFEGKPWRIRLFDIKFVVIKDNEK